MVKVKAEFTISLGNISLTADEVEIETLDEEEENKFLEISLRDKTTAREVSIIVSTNDLKKVLRATEEDWQQLLEKAIEERERDEEETDSGNP